MKSRHFKYLEKSGLLETVRAEFDERYYLETYAELIDPEVDPFIDFIEVGWKAGRNPSRNFNTRYYLGMNQDVAKSGTPPLAHFVAHGRAEGRRATPWTDEEVRISRARVLARAQANLSALPRGFLQRHSSLDVTLLMLSNERLDDTMTAIRSIQENVAIPFRLLVIDNGSSPETQRQLQEPFSADDRIRFVMRNDDVGGAGSRNFGAGLVDTEFTMFVDNNIEVMPGTVEHLLHRMEREPDAAATTSMVVLPNGTIQLCGGSYRRGSDVTTPLLYGSGEPFDDFGDVPSQCDWVPGCATLIRTDLLQRFPFDDGMSYYEDIDWALRLEDEASEWTLVPVPESLIIHHAEPVTVEYQLDPEEDRRARLARLADLATIYQRHGFVHADAFVLLPEFGWYDRQISLSSMKLLFALLTQVGVDGVAEMWRAGTLDSLVGAAKLDAKRWVLEAENDAAAIRRRSLESSLSLRVVSRMSRVVDSVCRPVRTAVGHLRVAASRRRPPPTVQNMVSTILPVFNRADLAEQAVESVLKQTYRPIEILIVDDGSTDDTSARMARLARMHSEVRYVRIRQSGGRIGHVREAGRVLAKGEFIQYLDSDDILHPEKFEVMVQALRSDPDCDIALCQAKRYSIGRAPSGSPMWPVGEPIDNFLAATYKLRGIWPTSDPLIRRSLSDRTGEWADLRQWEDVEYWIRMAGGGARTHYCDAWLVDIRDHSGARASGLVTPAERFAGLAALADGWMSAGVDLSSPKLDAFRAELSWTLQRCLDVDDRDTATAVSQLLQTVAPAVTADAPFNEVVSQNAGSSRATRPKSSSG